MKKNDFKKLSNALTKTALAFQLCFDKTTIQKVSVSYSLEEFEIDFEIRVEDLGIGVIKINHQSDSACELVESFVDSLIEQLDSLLASVKEKEIETKTLWESHRVYLHEYSYVPSVIAIEMVKEIIVSMFAWKK
jgi:hypothetical protein